MKLHNLATPTVFARAEVVCVQGKTYEEKCNLGNLERWMGFWVNQIRNTVDKRNSCKNWREVVEDLGSVRLHTRLDIRVGRIHRQ